MNKLIILNHKMNLIYDDIYEYISLTNKLETDNNIIICPSNIYLSDFVNHSDWSIGSQNVHSEIEGSYTGEVSTNQLRSIGVEYSIIGHPERQIYNHENDHTTNEKLIACLDGNLIPIVCLTKESDDELEEQLATILKDISHIELIIFAFEPSSMIETDSDIDISYIQDKIDYIYEYLHDKYHVNPTIIYGGSISETNINPIMTIPNLAGVMIGKKSSNIKEVQKLINIIEK